MLAFFSFHFAIYFNTLWCSPLALTGRDRTSEGYAFRGLILDEKREKLIMNEPKSKNERTDFFIFFKSKVAKQRVSGNGI